VIDISSLTKAYHQESASRTIFSGFDLSIAKGQHIGLFGENGTGKSTLLNIIAGVDKDFYGVVSVRAQRVGYLHQDVAATLVPWFTCEKNILMAREYHNLNTDEAKDLLKRLSDALHLSFSLQAHPSHLSGGQRQIVGLLRALMLEPDLLILDEPFAHLDAQKRKELIDVLNESFGDMTVLISSHRGEDVLPLITRAILLHGHPSVVSRDIRASDDDASFCESVRVINFPAAEDALV
jgi:NitT/TauT family transport system ATP-binding protein